MKMKLFKLIPLLFLVGCGQLHEPVQNQVKEETPSHLYYEDNIPVYNRDPSSSHTTYLMLSRYGRIMIDDEEVKGSDVAGKYEYCVALKDEAGTALPEAYSSLGNEVVFRGWFQYNGNIFPDKVTTVPSQNNQLLYAIFDGPTGGGSSGGGGGGGGGGDANTFYFTNNWKWDDLHIYLFSDNGEKSSWPGDSLTLDSTNEYGEDIYVFTADPTVYTKFIINGKSNGNSVQTVDVAFSEMTGNACYISGGSGNAHTLGYWNK